MGKLVLIRHGESVWNKKGLWTGWHDVPLSKKGRQEAKDAALAINNIDFHLTFASDLTRTIETLEIIKKELNLSHIPTTKHASLKERHYGVYAGKSKWQIQKRVGDEKFKKLRRGWNEPIEGGETLKDVYDRVISYYQKSIAPHLHNKKNVLLVAHGNSIRALIKHLEGVSHEDIEEIEIKTGEVLLYEVNSEGKIITKVKRKVNLSPSKQK